MLDRDDGRGDEHGLKCRGDGRRTAFSKSAS
jgi:hypothetical protein